MGEATGKRLIPGTPTVITTELAGPTAAAEGHREGDHGVHTGWAARQAHRREELLLVGAHGLVRRYQGDLQYSRHARTVAGTDAGGDGDADGAGLLLYSQGCVDRLAHWPQGAPGGPHCTWAQQQPQQQPLGHSQCLSPALGLPSQVQDPLSIIVILAFRTYLPSNPFLSFVESTSQDTPAPHRSQDCPSVPVRVWWTWEMPRALHSYLEPLHS